jgi:hypothetical protein
MMEAAAKNLTKRKEEEKEEEEKEGENCRCQIENLFSFRSCLIFISFFVDDNVIK